MSDGFSDPDPAVTGDSQPGVPSVDDIDPVIDAGDFEAIGWEEDGILYVDAEASCVDCSHFNVCSIFESFAGMLASEAAGQTEGEASTGERQEIPVDPEKLAMHCREYDPVDQDNGGTPTQTTDQ